MIYFRPFKLKDLEQISQRFNEQFHNPSTGHQDAHDASAHQQHVQVVRDPTAAASIQTVNPQLAHHGSQLVQQALQLAQPGVQYVQPAVQQFVQPTVQPIVYQPQYYQPGVFAPYPQVLSPHNIQPQLAQASTIQYAPQLLYHTPHSGHQILQHHPNVSIFLNADVDNLPFLKRNMRANLKY